ncbi:MAG: 30S ribosomal protein S12 methylthiotransferase RimO [Rhodocyclaceae bacterium]|nr:30S ribosomal protein S12 methylthiotransferase RimO [Rhodocyclaceae bacterium]
MSARRKTPRIGFVSLGCPKAAADAELILTRLRAEGYEFSPSYRGADLVIVNTCGFIDAAIEESLAAIGEALDENGKVIVTGCLGARPETIRERHPHVLAIAGPHALEEVMSLVHAHAPKPHDPFEDLVPPQGLRLTPSHYAYLKIAEGCNHRCSFCIIPSLRGPLASRPLAEVVKEAETLVKAGVKELILIAQDTAAYGMDLKHRTGFLHGRPVKTRLYELCKELGSLGVWIRLHYVYPYSHVDDLLPLMAEGKLLPYLDVPFQHASPRILRAMKRPGDVERVLERIAGWRKAVPNLTIRSTFITGFPGETESDFEELLDFLDEARLDRVGAFAYSAVAGAAANELPGMLPEAVREERKARLLRHQEEISLARLSALIGQTMTVLVDECDEEGAIARTMGDAPDVDGVVYVQDGQDLRPGEFVEVEITDCDVHDLYARCR